MKNRSRGGRRCGGSRRIHSSMKGIIWGWLMMMMTMTWCCWSEDRFGVKSWGFTSILRPTRLEWRFRRRRTTTRGPLLSGGWPSTSSSSSSSYAFLVAMERRGWWSWDNEAEPTHNNNNNNTTTCDRPLSPSSISSTSSSSSAAASSAAASTSTFTWGVPSSSSSSSSGMWQNNNVGGLGGGTLGDIMEDSGLWTSPLPDSPGVGPSLAQRYHLTHPLDRVALTANGNLQRLVSSYYDAPVHIVVDSCRLRTNDEETEVFDHATFSSSLGPEQPSSSSSSSFAAGTTRPAPQIWDRVVHLTVWNQTFCTARSVITVWDPTCQAAVQSGRVGLGQLFRHLNVLPHFSLHDAGPLPLPPSRHGPTTDGGGGFWRDYTLHGAQVSCRIQEEFCFGLWNLQPPPSLLSSSSSSSPPSPPPPPPFSSYSSTLLPTDLLGRLDSESQREERLKSDSR